MNKPTIRFLLLTMPTIVAVTWGALNRTATVPFALAAAVIFAVVLAIGAASSASIGPKSIVATAAIGGVIAALLGLPLAVLAMLPLGRMGGHFAIGYQGPQGMSPALFWSSTALILATGGALLCAAAALTGRRLRRLQRGGTS